MENQLKAASMEKALPDIEECDDTQEFQNNNHLDEFQQQMNMSDNYHRDKKTGLT